MRARSWLPTCRAKNIALQRFQTPFWRTGATWAAAIAGARQRPRRSNCVFDGIRRSKNVFASGGRSVRCALMFGFFGLVFVSLENCQNHWSKLFLQFLAAGRVL